MLPRPASARLTAPEQGAAEGGGMHGAPPPARSSARGRLLEARSFSQRSSSTLGVPAEAVTPYSKPSPQPLNPTLARSLALALP